MPRADREPDCEPEGGDPACWSHLVCPDCGSVRTEGHRLGCPTAGSPQLGSGSGGGGGGLPPVAVPAPVVVARVYEDPGRRPGDHRVLVDRLWPRGLRRAALDLDEWAKDVAPSPELRRWYGHDPGRFAEFEHRYRRELARQPAAPVLDRLREAGLDRRVVLLTATRDLDHSGATVLCRVLRSEPPPGGGRAG
jgi:uncharacterized protein YeaO (DUF488 family)